MAADTAHPAAQDGLRELRGLSPTSGECSASALPHESVPDVDLGAVQPSGTSMRRLELRQARAQARGAAIASGIAALSVATMVAIYGGCAALEALIGVGAMRLAISSALLAGLAASWRGQVAAARLRRITPEAKPWWPRFPLVTLTAATVTSLVSIATLASLGDAVPDTSSGLFGALHLDPTRTLAGESYRLASVALLHVDPAHLVLNMTGLVVLGVGLRGELWLGHRGLAATYLAAVIGASVASLLVLRQPAAGASGGVMGLTGALLVRFAGLQRDPVFSDGLRAEFRLRSRLLALSAVLTLGLGLAAALTGALLVDNGAHVAGLAVGIAAGIAVHSRRAPHSGYVGRGLAQRPMAQRSPSPS